MNEGRKLKKPIRYELGRLSWLPLSFATHATAEPVAYGLELRNPCNVRYVFLLIARDAREDQALRHFIANGFSMSVKVLLAKILQSELAARGADILTPSDYEQIAERLVEQVNDIELSLSARSFSSKPDSE